MTRTIRTTLLKSFCFTIFVFSAFPVRAQCPGGGCINVDDQDIFELESDANLINEAPAGPDWQSVSAQVVSETGNVTTFTQGGSKDINGINKWKHTNGSVPDKDDISNGYAYSTTVDGQLLVYFGGDRIANNGDANMGFWFFQDEVGLNMDGSGTFSGGHTDGDIFVVSGFTSGGQTSEIAIYRWECPNPAMCDETGSLVLVSSGANAECVLSANGSKTACASSNDNPTVAINDYTPKSGTAGTYPVASFFEGGVNLAALDIPITTCFSTFMVETRSSTSNNAQLKDFTLGSFNSCGVEIMKECPTTVSSITQPLLVNNGTALRYSFGGQIKNLGAATLTNVTVTDTFSAADLANITPTPDTLVGSVATWNLGSLPGGECMRWPTGTSVACDDSTDPAIDYGTFETSTNGGNLDSASVMATVGSSTISDGPATASCPSFSGLPAISVSKNCSTAISSGASVPIGVTVNFDGEVCNQSAVAATISSATDVQIDGSMSTIGAGGTVTFSGVTPVVLQGCSDPGNCNISDDPSSCRSFTGSYSPSQVSKGTDACSFAFDDKVSITATYPLLPAGSNSATNTATASCPLCACED